MKQKDITARLYSNKSLSEAEYREYLRATWDAVAGLTRQMKGMSDAMKVFDRDLSIVALALEIQLDSVQHLVNRVQKDDKFGVHVGSEEPQDE